MLFFSSKNNASIFGEEQNTDGVITVFLLQAEKLRGRNNYPGGEKHVHMPIQSCCSNN